MSDNNQQD